MIETVNLVRDIAAQIVGRERLQPEEVVMVARDKDGRQVPITTSMDR